MTRESSELSPSSLKGRAVELVGLAGAGKSTLLQALSREDPRIIPGIRAPKRMLAPILIRNTMTFLPAFLRDYRRSRWFTLAEMRSMAYLSGWQHVLRRARWRNDEIVVIDHGPIFRLAVLGGFGPEFAKSKIFNEWWDEMLRQWATILRLVVWLDAPDEILLRRIRARSQKHILTGQSEEFAYRFFERYRSVYQGIIGNMRRIADLRLMHIDTNNAAIDDIVKKINGELWSIHD